MAIDYDKNNLYCFEYEGKFFKILLKENWYANKNYGKNPNGMKNGSDSFYEIDLLEAIREIVPNPQVVVDAGAAWGNHTVYFNKVMGAQVIAIEPYKKVLEYLKKNIELNEADDVIIENCAAHCITETNSDVVFKEPEEGHIGGGRLTVPLEEYDCVDIDLKRIDDIVYEHDVPTVDIIKIDVEGCEGMVLSGSTNLIDAVKPLIACECKTKYVFSSINKFLSERGYVPYKRYALTPTWIFVNTSKHKINY